MSNVIEELRWRGLLQDATEGAAEHLAGEARTVYIGFDPSAASLHVGNLLVVMDLVHMQRHGHTPIALVGGGTGLIGDPSGKSSERQLLTKEVAALNAESIRGQLAHFLDFEIKSNPAIMRNNLDWLGELSLVDFLRDIGKHFSVNQLIAKEAVKRRLANEETGLSYTEFSYALLQSYDFLELYRRDQCTVQLGGSDQWGNITAGTDLVRRAAGGKAFGVVSPLLTNSSGAKFGKTEAGNVWLDPKLTPPFAFYQFWVNTDDRDVIRFLRCFSLLSQAEIGELEEATQVEPGKRLAQRVLADEVTLRVHGQAGLEAARKATRALFGGDISGLNANEISEVFVDVPSSEIQRGRLEGDGIELLEILAESGVASSKGDARRAIEGGGIYLNGERIQDVSHALSIQDAIEGRYLLLRKGKRAYHLIAVCR